MSSGDPGVNICYYPSNQISSNLITRPESSFEPEIFVILLSRIEVYLSCPDHFSYLQLLVDRMIPKLRYQRDVSHYYFWQLILFLSYGLILGRKVYYQHRLHFCMNIFDPKPLENST